MSVVWTSGDLFLGEDLPGLAHGCNCAGAMGAGIAVGFKERWPRMFEAYRLECEEGRFNPGDVFVWEEEGRTIFNLGTQKHWRTKATLGAIETSLTRMVSLADEKEIRRVGLPRIGAGYGGLSWGKVRGVIERIGEPARVTLVVFESFVPSVK
jgi:O-acetyl-ADP-ribose deacetylase (regulator of RNase III)